MAIYRVTTEVGMLVQVEIEAGTVEEAIRIAEQSFRITAKVQVIGEGPSGWQSDDLLVTELDPVTREEKDNPGSDTGPEHFHRARPGASWEWVQDNHSFRARYRINTAAAVAARAFGDKPPE